MGFYVLAKDELNKQYPQGKSISLDQIKCLTDKDACEIMYSNLKKAVDKVLRISE
jgi:hypothetical protein